MDAAKLGLWGNDDLTATVKCYSGSQYYQPLPDNVRFVHSVAKIISTCHARDKDELCSAPSLYVLGTVPEGVVKPKREPAFSLGGVVVSGKIWFGAQAMNSANGVAIPECSDADALFTFVSDTLKSGSRPAIYFDGTANEEILRFFPKGVDFPEECEDIPLGGAHLNEATLKIILDRIHERHMKTPTASALSGKLWSNKPKCYPTERAEYAVQSILEIGLGTALGNVRAKREGTGVYGRYDLVLVEQDKQDSSKVINHAVLELKVIRGFTSTGAKVADITNQTAVLKGVKQAFAYRQECGARISALCCYDMRPNPNLHKHSGRGCQIATDFEVEFWAWPLFSTTEAARDRLAENHLNKEA